MKYIDRLFIALLNRPAVKAALFTDLLPRVESAEFDIKGLNKQVSFVESEAKDLEDRIDSMVSRMISLESSFEDLKALDESDIESIIDDRVPSLVDDQISDFCYSRDFRDEVDERVDNTLTSFIEHLSDKQLDALDTALAERRAEREAEKKETN